MSRLRELWLRWKMLRLPWRKTFLVGQDLSGNTFWEFKDALNSNRFRRKVRFRNKTHFSDAQVSPLWHQWLRHTRADPPSLQEQTADVTRQIQLKHNARLADERWANKAPYIQPPPQHQPQQQLQEPMDAQAPPRIATNPGQDFKPAAWVPGSKSS
ncbi:hypothetical protein DV735_g3515, partial [Chaetothyriales sp. CBS 134920]